MSKRIVTKTAAQELRDLKAKYGTLKPVHVVKRAKAKTSPLHSYFEWDNSKAAYQHRLEQARDLIVSVKIVFTDIPRQKTIKAREWVSLPSDRMIGGGYRSLQSVLSDEELRAELLRSALQDLQAFKDRYNTLSELVHVFAAIDKAAVKNKRSGRGKRTRKAA